MEPGELYVCHNTAAKLLVRHSVHDIDPYYTKALGYWFVLSYVMGDPSVACMVSPEGDVCYVFDGALRRLQEKMKRVDVA